MLRAVLFMRTSNKRAAHETACALGCTCLGFDLVRFAVIVIVAVLASFAVHASACLNVHENTWVVDDCLQIRIDVVRVVFQFGPEDRYLGFSVHIYVHLEPWARCYIESPGCRGFAPLSRHFFGILGRTQIDDVHGEALVSETFGTVLIYP